jgi:hypothetical protein
MTIRKIWRTKPGSREMAFRETLRLIERAAIRAAQKAEVKRYWTPARRAKAARLERIARKQRRIERMLVTAIRQAEGNGWDTCEWPRWQRRFDQPPSDYGYEAIREWGSRQSEADATLEHWRRVIADRASAKPV